MKDNKATVAATTAANKADVLDQETRALLGTAKKKNTQVFLIAIFFYTVLLVLGILGIYRQNQIAAQNKGHIDCIVKFLTAPIPAGSTHKVISDPVGACNVRGTN